MDKISKINFNGLSGAGFFLIFRLVLFAILPYQVFLGYGDLINFFHVAQIPGWPYLHYWVEFPPIFPFVSELLYRLVGGMEWKYVYSLAGIFSIFDAGSIFVFWELTKKNGALGAAKIRLFVYVLILCVFPYGWWYFEPMVVFFFLLAVYYVLGEKPVFFGAAIAVGFLLKVFPILVFIPAWLTHQKKSFVISVSLFSIIVAAVFGLLWEYSPSFTPASIGSQNSKGSWETVWALLDGNMGTGNFGPLAERLEPSLAFEARGNPARIPAIIPLTVAGLAGFVVLLKLKNRSNQGRIAILGLGWSLLVLASPGWSPQWILMIIPICLLVFPPLHGALLSGLLIVINLAEWPLLFSQGRTDLLWTTIILRTLVLIILCLLFAQTSLQNVDKTTFSGNIQP
ncbi:MAG: hypothetical protein WCG34_03860 [Leptolinea sp.]